jgi:hypothetical protein
VRPLVVSHTERAGNSHRFIFGLLRYRPADLRPVCMSVGDRPDAQAMCRLGVEATALRRKAAQRRRCDRSRIDVIPQAAPRRLS